MRSQTPFGSTPSCGSRRLQLSTLRAWTSSSARRVCLRVAVHVMLFDEGLGVDARGENTAPRWDVWEAPPRAGQDGRGLRAPTPRTHMQSETELDCLDGQAAADVPEGLASMRVQPNRTIGQLVTLLHKPLRVRKVGMTARGLWEVGGGCHLQVRHRRGPGSGWGWARRCNDAGTAPASSVTSCTRASDAWHQMPNNPLFFWLAPAAGAFHWGPVHAAAPVSGGGDRVQRRHAAPHERALLQCRAGWWPHPLRPVVGRPDASQPGPGGSAGALGAADGHRLRVLLMPTGTDAQASIAPTPTKPRT